MLCFFFFKQKTAYEMRISDWSSDVCSSDLTDPVKVHFIDVELHRCTAVGWGRFLLFAHECPDDVVEIKRAVGQCPVYFGGNALKVNPAYFHRVVQQFQHADVYPEFFAGKECVARLVLEIYTFEYQHFG